MLHISKIFHQENSFIKSERVLSESEWPRQWKTIYYKHYPRASHFHLPKPALSLEVPLDRVLRNRESARTLGEMNTIDAEMLSSLLYYCCGHIHSEDSPRGLTRPYPSAGARYPLEVYLAVNRSANIPKGVYHYYLPDHSLEHIRPDQFTDEIRETLMHDRFKNAGAFIIISAVFDRNLEKYGDRGYRYILEEVGAMTQNLYLVGAAIGLSVLTIGGFEDGIVNEVLDFDGIEESAVAFIALGKE